MSVTFSEVAASALRDASRQPGLANKRLALKGLFGLQPEAIFLALEPDLDAAVTVKTGAGEQTVQAIELSAGRLLIPYLVSDDLADTNRGSAGFAATLRTEFLAGAAEERVLLILDSHPVETVLSASEDASELPHLAWDELVLRFLRMTAETLGVAESDFARHAVQEFAKYSSQTKAALDLLAGWLTGALQGSEAAAGKSLWKLGCFLSDPDASNDYSRFEPSADWRRRIDERYESKSKSWASEIQRLLSRKRVPGEIVNRVIAAAGPFEVDYERFTLTDLQQSEGAPTPLQTDEFEPVLASRATIRSGDSLLVWVGGGVSQLELRLSRQAQAGDAGLARWAGGGNPGELEMVAGSTTAKVLLPEAPSSGWHFASLELHPKSAAGFAGLGETLELAVYRSDGGWLPAEISLEIDPASAGFACDDDPLVVAFGEGGEQLGNATADPLPEDLDDTERVELPVTFNGEDTILPVLVRGGVSPEDPEPPEPPENPDDTDGDGGGGDGSETPAIQSEYPSINLALLAARRTEWPDAKLTELDGVLQTAFNIGARQFKVALQRPAGIDGSRLERAILEHPEWTSYVWSEQTETLTRGRGPGISEGALPGHLVEQFRRAREELFAKAAEAGSIYALNPENPEVTAYIAAYDALLAQVPADARYEGDWDGLVLCDTVVLAGELDLLVSPTSPLSVAFHAATKDQFSAWTAAADVPTEEDVAAVSIRHAVPLLNAGSRWFESAPLEEVLWRRYVPLTDDAPGVPERNAKFIAQRLHFFLRVHETYKDPAQTLSVAFHEPGDGKIVLEALRSFYSRDRGAGAYSLPRLHAHLVGASAELNDEVAKLLADGRQDDLDRLVQSRVTVTATPASEAPAFAHVTFLFRSPGTRTARQVPMSDRSPTDHLHGLAASPGRHVYSERNKVFAWGTWAAGSADAPTYQRLVSRSLELVGGQPTGRLTEGWTQMPSASLDQEALDELYSEQSVWVVHLDRLIGIEAFGGPRQLIEYEERADPDQPGYDGITATEQIEPYMEAVGRALAGFGNPDDQALKRLLQLLNAVSGRWALELLQRNDADILQRIGFVAAIALIEQLEDCLGTREDGTGVLIALDELIAGRGRAGLPRFSLPVKRPDGKMCDDLLVLWVPRDKGGDDPVTLRGAVIEVKYASSGRPNTDDARGEITRTREWLHAAFNTDGSTRPFRARDLAEIINAAASRATTFDLGRPARQEALTGALKKIARGAYRLDLSHTRLGESRTGIAVSVEGESSVPTNQSVLAEGGQDLDLLRVGRPVLQQLVSGKRVSAGGSWETISFSPPAEAETAQEPTEPVAGPPPASPRTSEEDLREARDGATEAPGSATSSEEAQLLPEMGRALDSAMEKYRLAVEPFQPELAQVGPNVIRFRTKALGPLSVSDVERRARDIGREVGAPGAVIVSQEPRFICIDVPRAERSPVLYRDLAPRATSEAMPGALDFIVGVAPSGDVRVADLARLPHLLVAGATGSGKSVFLRSLLCHLVATRGPDALRILLVDPKQLDFANFSQLPHLVGGRIVSDPADAVQSLEETIEDELARRRPILMEAGATSATEYYEAGGSHQELSQMVVLVDEFADLAAVMSRRERQGFQELIQRYAQITRAFGIYLVLATQRPSVDVITGSIKANLTARIAFSLPSHRDSMTVLDRSGAEDLLGNGDLLFYVNGQVERLQAPLADSSDVASAVERWRNVANPEHGS
jgi:FtsK/SpoIIIE family